MEKQTAGHDQLGDFAPQFAELNDDVLFGQVWAREDQLSPRDRSLITIAALMTNGDYEQLKYHLQHEKDNGITKDEIVETVTQLAFYVGWPKAWTVLKMAKEIWK
ncbi:carboxymuconolactone decarboxylase family protein [Ligilactobacillus sp. 110_WCHN]|uniref:carboxymuconolactone decarboxylase family protein n=1 Tax=Ligilactobacillus sp. 110_WCHN TaxID=3057125 RepID=UPI002673FFE5|nr:carboxymuconolactone decarboxylase family protein [Ligilactobacillus sp. 110_WCHN]MDO3393662.1 carboxymuconolactone decarboxylase family protein [Ligilactobacillus sp. 110_WCHN]